MTHRFTSVEEIGLGEELWAYARGWWRRVRVVAMGGNTVTVAFRLIGLNARDGAFRLQRLPLHRLRRTCFRPAGRVLEAQAPTDEEIRARYGTEASR